MIQYYPAFQSIQRLPMRYDSNIQEILRLPNNPTKPIQSRVGE